MALTRSGSRRHPRARRLLFPVFAGVILFGALLFSPVFAADTPARAEENSSSASQPKQTHRNPDGLHTGSQLAEESREAAGEDDTDKFKKSPSVEFVAKITGLSLQHAYWLSVLLNFAVVVGAIVWLSRKYLPGVFRARTSQIQKAMEEARAASQDANRRLAEIESRLSHLDAEITDLRTAAENEAAAEAVRIRKAAEEDARKIVEAAEVEISTAAKSARRELKVFAADLAVSLAVQQIQVDPSTDESLVRDFASQLALNGGSKKDGH